MKRSGIYLLTSGIPGALKSLHCWLICRKSFHKIECNGQKYPKMTPEVHISLPYREVSLFAAQGAWWGQLINMHFCHTWLGRVGARAGTCCRRGAELAIWKMYCCWWMHTICRRVCVVQHYAETVFSRSSGSRIIIRRWYTLLIISQLPQKLRLIFIHVCKNENPFFEQCIQFHGS